MIKNLVRYSFLFLLYFGFTDIALSSVSIKMGVLAPKGTTWANALEKISKDVEEATSGEVKFKMYLGAVQGDEPVVLRKIRMNQMQGGVFTGKTLAEINGDIRLMEVPFTFMEDREKAWKVLSKMAPFYDEGFKKSKFKNLGYFEIGLVHMIMTKKAQNFEELKGVKIWAWEGDELSNTLIQSMHLISVPLALPDVLSALSTGIIEAAYASPLAILAMQWQSKVKYFIDFPITFAIGAFVVEQAMWEKIPVKWQKRVEEICKKNIDEANLLTVKENIDAKGVLMKGGIESVKLSKESISQGLKIRKEVISKLSGKMFTAKGIELFEKQL